MPILLFRRARAFASTWLALSALALLPAAAPAAQQAAQSSPNATATRPAELFEVVKIVDGDTVHIQRGEKLVKLRLLSVDTEEKLTPGMNSSASKPQTVFGEETRLWTIEFFEQFREPDGNLRIGLRFPEGREAYDIYGRLLCHVLMPDGTDFNLLLVELGKSPYFNKYGNSLIDHEAFVRMQRLAQRHRLGIWDPSINGAATEGTPSAKRPYDQLLPWWEVRAEAIDDFRARSKRAPAKVVSAEDPEGLAAALASGEEIEVFGTPDRFFDEKDGSLTVLFRTSERDRALRVGIPADARAAFEAIDLRGLREEYRQNYAFVSGAVVKGPRGFRIETPSTDSWRRAGRDL